MDLSIIIVSWNVKALLQANLEALLKSQGLFSFEIFVVDNNSSDGSAAMIRENFPTVHLLDNTENLGFAKANNQALKLTQGKFILLLNPDMLVQRDTLEKVLAWASNQAQATVVSCRLLNPAGENIPHVRRFPKLFDQLMVTLKVPHFWPAVLNKYLSKDFDYQEASRVDSVRGSFFLINRRNYQQISGQPIPLFDERYFLWFEEVDFCRQAYKLGGEVWYTPEAVCLDQVGQSFKQVKTKQAQSYFSNSMLNYFKKWQPRWQYRVLYLAWKLIRGLLVF